MFDINGFTAISSSWLRTLLALSSWVSAVWTTSVSTIRRQRRLCGPWRAAMRRCQRRGKLAAAERVNDELVEGPLRSRENGRW
jgi:hypothetical protein